MPRQLLRSWGHKNSMLLKNTSDTFLTTGFSVKEAGRGGISCSAFPVRMTYLSILPILPKSEGGTQRTCRSTAKGLGGLAGETARVTFSALPGGSTTIQRIKKMSHFTRRGTDVLCG